LLQKLPGIRDITAKKLVDHYGSAQAVFNEKKINLLNIKGIGAFHLQGFDQFDRYLPAVIEEEKNLKKRANNFAAVSFSRLSQSIRFYANAPLVLFQKRGASWKNERILSIVGTRNPTSREVDFCKQLIEDLAEYNSLIVSGFARGIDIVAHKAALDNG
jgi:DNA processing protein